MLPIFIYRNATIQAKHTFLNDRMRQQQTARHKVIIFVCTIYIHRNLFIGYLGTKKCEMESIRFDILSLRVHTRLAFL